MDILHQSKDVATKDAGCIRQMTEKSFRECLAQQSEVRLAATGATRGPPATVVKFIIESRTLPDGKNHPDTLEIVVLPPLLSPFRRTPTP